MLATESKLGQASKTVEGRYGRLLQEEECLKQQKQSNGLPWLRGGTIDKQQYQRSVIPQHQFWMLLVCLGAFEWSLSTFRHL